MTLRPLIQVLGLALLLALPVSWSKEAVPSSDDPALEARVLEIAEQLRCLVCQNETIAASRADLATDLRNQIRIKLQANQSRQEILDFMVARYGDFVLYKPPLKTSTVLLWVGPFLLLILASIVLARTIRRRRLEQQSEVWTPEQEARARALLGETGDPR
jgi:cytochrome c-type biogenesis protein CcmH